MNKKSLCNILFYSVNLYLLSILWIKMAVIWGVGGGD